MFYKPKFCAECGEKVERVEWKLWTSGRFCDDCARQLENPIRWKTGIVAVCVLVVGIFAGQIGRITPKPVTVTNAQASVSNSSSNAAGSNQVPKAAVQSAIASSNSSANSIAQASPAQNKTIVNPPPIVTTQTEATYYCGAKTQKGTICTRRVKGGGRCWQHVGKPPMLPQERLLIQTESR